MTRRTLVWITSACGALWLGACGGSVAPGTEAPSTTVQLPRAPALYRETPQSCQGVHNPPEPTGLAGSGSTCLQHADCTKGLNGKCVTGAGYMYGRGYCAYDTCQTDSDCDPGRVCYCTASTAARCLYTGNCQSDADCGTGNYCSPAVGEDCGGHHSVNGYHCHTSKDTCIDNADCSGNNYCNFNVYKNLWECSAPNMQCAVG